MVWKDNLGYKIKKAHKKSTMTGGLIGIHLKMNCLDSRHVPKHCFGCYCSVLQQVVWDISRFFANQVAPKPCPGGTFWYHTLWFICFLKTFLMNRYDSETVHGWLCCNDVKHVKLQIDRQVTKPYAIRIEINAKLHYEQVYLVLMGKK